MSSFYLYTCKLSLKFKFCGVAYDMITLALKYIKTHNHKSICLWHMKTMFITPKKFWTLFLMERFELDLPGVDWTNLNGFWSKSEEMLFREAKNRTKRVYWDSKMTFSLSPKRFSFSKNMSCFPCGSMLFHQANICSPIFSKEKIAILGL